MALTRERLASVTEGAERAAHVQGAREAWLSMNLTAEAERSPAIRLSHAAGRVGANRPGHPARASASSPQSW